MPGDISVVWGWGRHLVGKGQRPLDILQSTQLPQMSIVLQSEDPDAVGATCT